MNLTTTLSILREHQPCSDGWAKLLRYLGPDWPEDKAIPFSTILESNGVDDAIWALRAVSPDHEIERDRLARLFACDCAEAALPIFEKKYPDDKRPRHAIEVARAFANGETTSDESNAAWDAARAAAMDAAGAASWDAARAAAWAAWASARDAAKAAEAAAWAAWASARDAASERQSHLFKKYFCT
jgi:hypothetical protein